MIQQGKNGGGIGGIWVKLNESEWKMIDGVLSGKLLLPPKTMYTVRGTEYVIAKMTVYGYANSNLQVENLDGDIIAFDRAVCAELKNKKQGDVFSILGTITPILKKKPSTGQELPLTLYITARKLYDGYVTDQARGKGKIFQVLGCWKTGFRLPENIETLQNGGIFGGILKIYENFII